ncbi:MAG: hypothetical protein DME08_25095 [Candidatus Rokuibacteriota bacterium]|nr:MAG: hypothetical protein DME08_25095 [Candidatus Rokubacteria bacterium]
MRPTIVEVRLARLTENYRAIRTAVAPAAVMPIVKANAYGHGLVDVARHLIGLGAPSLGVGLLEEAVALRDAGVTTASGNIHSRTTVAPGTPSRRWRRKNSYPVSCGVARWNGKGKYENSRITALPYNWNSEAPSPARRRSPPFNTHPPLRQNP